MQPQVSKVPIFRTLKWTTKLYFNLFPWSTVTIIVTGILDYITPIGSNLVFAFVIDSLVSAATNKDSSSIPSLIAIMFAYYLLQRLNKVLYRYCLRIMRSVGRNKLRQKLFEKLHEIDIEHLESPDLQNKLQRVDENISLTTDFIEMATNFVGNIFGIISLIIIILSFSPSMVVIIVLFSLPMLFSNKYFIRKDWEIEFNSTEERRKASFSASYLTDTRNLHEVNIIGGYNFLAGKYKGFYDWYNQKKIANRRRWLSTEYILEAISQGALLTGVADIFVRFINGVISLGTLTFQLSTLRNLQSSIGELSYTITNFQENATRIGDFFDLMNKDFKSSDGSIELPRLENGPQIEFNDISFSYPNSSQSIFNDLNLKIQPGEKIAIVGHNGAGKTTLVRLISRLYRPTKGTILVNDIDLNTLRIDDWYKNIGVLFQDYNTYAHLTVKENIYIGRSIKALDEAKIESAAQSSDALEFINEFPNKFDQLLSERLKGGKRPSTGQWQKLAIARFFYRNAPLVIFDEPTASIDAVSEFKIFNRIYDFFKGKTVIIISHRFSTVRNADRILVMDHGKIIEQGTHAQLMELGGKYAEAFKLQAEGYN